jgi:hypothetical protein
VYFIVSALLCQRSTPRWFALPPDLASTMRPVRTVHSQRKGISFRLNRFELPVTTVAGGVF